jgi:hypothetical protein
LQDIIGGEIDRAIGGLDNEARAWECDACGGWGWKLDICF